MSVVPTHVGMNRVVMSSSAARSCGPHARGDEPAGRPDPLLFLIPRPLDIQATA